MSLEQYIEKAFWALFLGVVTFGVSFIKELSTNVSDLNNKVSIILMNSERQSEMIRDHEGRLITLERRRY